MLIRRGDIVATKTTPTIYGVVVRVAKDGSWADVNWGIISKRMSTEHLIKPQEIPAPTPGEDFEIALIQRESMK